MTAQSFKARTTAVLIPDASATQSGVVNTTTQTFAGAKTFDGFSSFGTGNTGLKCKQLTGTSAATEGGQANIAHGLSSNTKVVGIQILLQVAADTRIPTSYQFQAGYQYDFLVDNTNIAVLNHPTNSENILSKSVYVSVWYIA